MMQKLLLFKFQKNLDKGFTTLEVLVSIITALAFVTVAMQSFVLGMAMKVQAQEKQRANQLIQEDLELLSDRASVLAATSGNCNAAAYADGYADALWDDIDNVNRRPASTYADPDTTTLLSSGEGKRIVLSRNHVSDSSSNAPHRTLKINYQVQEIDSTDTLIGDVLANRYVEVIPDVALRCP